MAYLYNYRRKELVTATGAALSKNVSPVLVLGEQVRIELQLVDDDGEDYLGFPAGTTAELWIENDYKNPDFLLGLKAVCYAFMLGSEYLFSRLLPKDDAIVYFDGVEATLGVLGSLNAGEYYTDGLGSYAVRLFDSGDPRTKADDFVSLLFEEDFTVPFAHSTDFNTGSEDIELGEVAFDVNCDNPDFYTRIGTSAKDTSTFGEIRFNDGTSTEKCRFNVTCKNKVETI